MEWEKTFTCPSCGYDEIHKTLDELIIESTLAEEREMGSEMQHTIYYELKCPRISCRCDLLISGDIFEYPEGQISLDETTIDYLK
jgi:hypothetical protein